MLRPTGIRGQIREVDFGLHRGREFDLGFFGGFLQALQCLTVIVQVDAIILLELFDQVVHDAQVEVIATEEGIAASGLDLENAIAHFEDRNIECAATKVIHNDGFIRLLVETIRQ